MEILQTETGCGQHRKHLRKAGYAMRIPGKVRFQA
jgi:hypothetical protein